MGIIYIILFLNIKTWVTKEKNLNTDWEIYEDNGGTVCAIGGKGFCVIGGDSRLKRGYSILSRNQTKITKLTKKCVIATTGMHADRCELHILLQLEIREYELEHGQQMSIKSIAQRLSNMLYYKRFFPYYTFNVLAGLNEQNEGIVYGYDAIGSTEEKQYGQTGSGMSMISPTLDYAINRNHDQSFKNHKPELTLVKAKNLIKMCLNGVTERDIETGDDLQIFILTPDKIEIESFKMRQD